MKTTPTEPTRRVEFDGPAGDKIRAQFRAATTTNATGVLLVPGSELAGELVQATEARLAAAGHATLLPSIDTGELPDRGLTSILDGAADWFLREGGLHAEGLAIMGLGRGGTLALLLACTSDRPSAVVQVQAPIIYPELGPKHPVQPLEMALNLSCPLLAHFDGTDPHIRPEHIAVMERSLSQFARQFDIFVYPGADSMSSDLAWQRTQSFLDEVLAP